MRLVFSLTPLLFANSGLAAEPQNISAAEKTNANHYDKNALHRLDLRIVGKSCPVCLLGIQKKVNALSGVVKAAVMLKRPYGTTVIYDSKQIQPGKIIDTIKSYEKNTFVEDIKDAPIARMPIVLIPPFRATSETP